MSAVEEVELLRKTIAGFAVLADRAKNRGQRRRFEKSAAESYRKLQRLVRVHRLPRELAP